MKNKNKIISVITLSLLSICLYAFNYAPDTWSYCLDDTASYVANGESAPVTGYCNFAGTMIVENNEVDITQCQSSNNDPFGGGATCTGNGVLTAVVPR